MDHDTLISKLEHYGARGVTKECFYSYLKNRKQFASTEFVSNTKHVSRGVPQGSVLGPLQLIIYINDHHTCVKHSKTYNYADDSNFLSTKISHLKSR